MDLETEGATVRLNSNPSRDLPRITTRSISAPRVGRPEIALVTARAEVRTNDFGGKAFPRRPGLRVTFDIFEITQVQECVEQPAVGQIHLRRFDLPFAEVFVPRLQLANHERGCQDVNITSNGGVSHTKAARECGDVQDLAVGVGQHGPQPSESGRRNRDPELGQVTLEKGADELEAPLEAVSIRSGEKGPRETAANPQLLQLINTNLFRTEPAELEIRDPACQRLRALA